MWQALRRVCLVIAVVSAVWGAAPVFGAGWPLATPASTLCAYAEEYVRADGSTAVHTGVDIECGEGQSIQAVEGGTVTFAGSVPGSSGGTVIAVTVQTASGDKWSYMPLEQSYVTPGDEIGEGAVLGTVAACGDASSAASHVHVGLRRSDRYIDPTPLLVAPSASVPVPEPEPEPVVVPEAPATVVPFAVPAQPVIPTSPAPTEVPAGAQTHESLTGEVGVSQAGDSAVLGAVEAEAPVVAADTAPVAATFAGVAASTLSAHDPDARFHTGQSSAWSNMPQATGVSAVPSQGASAVASSRLGALSRTLIALFCLAPIAGASVFRTVKSRVTALGEPVAAAVSR